MEALMTVSEYAEAMKLHRDTVYRLIREGKLDAVRVGRSVRVYPPKVEREAQNVK